MLDKATYRISYEDQLSFSKLHQLRTIKSYALFLLCLVLIVSAIGFVLDSPGAAVGAVAGGLIALVIMPIIAWFVLIPVQTKRAYREFKVIQEEMTLGLCDETFSIEQSSGKITSPWEYIVKWDENDRIMALYPQRQMAYIFPKADISAAHIQFVRTKLIDSGLMAKGKLRK